MKKPNVDSACKQRLVLLAAASHPGGAELLSHPNRIDNALIRAGYLERTTRNTMRVTAKGRRAAARFRATESGYMIYIQVAEVGYWGGKEQIVHTTPVKVRDHADALHMYQEMAKVAGIRVPNNVL